MGDQRRQQATDGAAGTWTYRDSQRELWKDITDRRHKHSLWIHKQTSTYSIPSLSSYYFVTGVCSAYAAGALMFTWSCRG